MNSLVYLPVQASCPCAESFRLRLRDCRDDLYSFRGGRKPIRVLRWEVCDLVAASQSQKRKGSALDLICCGITYPSATTAKAPFHSLPSQESID